MVMRIDEGCTVIDSRSAVIMGLKSYVKKLFSLAHMMPVYILVEPVIIATRTIGKLIRLVAAPGSAIICEKQYKQAAEEFSSSFLVAEPSWGEAMLLIPLTSTSPWCSKARQLGIEIDYDGTLGTPHICIEHGGWNELKQVVGGGIAEVDKFTMEVVGELTIQTKRNTFFMLAKGLLSNMKLGRTSANIKDLRFDSVAEPYLDELVTIDNAVTVYGFGKGHIVAFSNLSEPLTDIYLLTLLASYIVDVNEAKALVYREKLIS
jgi:hypothetical protein